MESREIFMKGEIKLIKKILHYIVSYVPYSSALDDEERFIKIIQLLFEINEKTITLKRLIKGSFQSKILYQLSDIKLI